MKYLYNSLAQMIFATHILFGLWLLSGWLFPQYKIIYLTSLVAWIGSWLLLRVCPLTYIEFWLRQRGGELVNLHEEFIQHYTESWFGIKLRTASIYACGAAVFLVLLVLSVWQ